MELDPKLERKSISQPNSPGELTSSVSTARKRKESARIASSSSSPRARRAYPRRSSIPDLALGEEEIEKRQKHNEAEKRRRGVIAETLQQLASLVDCSPKDQKSVILKRACEMVQKLQERVSQLSRENIQLKTGQPDKGAGGRRRSVSEGLSLSPLSLKPISPLLLKRELSIEEFDPRSIVYSSLVGLLVVNVHGQIIDCNSQFCEIFGCTKISLLENGSSFYDPIHPAYLAVSPSFVTNLIERPSRTLRFRKRLVSVRGQPNVQVTCWAVAGMDCATGVMKDGTKITKHICVLVETLDEGVSARAPSGGSPPLNNCELQRPLLPVFGELPACAPVATSMPLQPLESAPFLPFGLPFPVRSDSESLVDAL